MTNEGAHNGGSRGNRRGRLASAEPWASMIGGGALAVYGATRKSVSGAALAGVGGLLIYHGATANRGPEEFQFERSQTILKPVEEVYRFFRNFENLPKFMSHLESVRTRPDDNRRSEWRAHGPLNSRVTWEAEITEESENRYIVWRSLPGSQIENVGSVEFRKAPGNRGTEVSVSLQYRPPVGRLGHQVARLFGQNPEQQIREDLRHLKQLLECGEIPTTEGQPHGRRSTVGKAAERAGREREYNETIRRQQEQAKVPA
jgi:uncharacterized membrane protein